MYVTLVISDCHCDGTDLRQVKVQFIHMEIWGDPAYPHPARLLPGEDTHRVIVLHREKESENDKQEK